MIATWRQSLLLPLLAVPILLAACTAQTGPQGWAAPVEADGLLIAAVGHKRLVAFRLPSHDQVWEFAGEGREAPLKGLYGTPVAAGGRLFAGDYNGSLYALELETGRLLWQFPTGGPIVATPLVRGATVYVGSSDGLLYAVDAASGQRRWAFPAQGAIWSAPVEAGNVVYFATVEGYVYAADAATGEPRWPRPFRPRAGIASALQEAEGLLLVGSMDRRLYALSTQTGEVRWAFKAENWFWSEPLVWQGTVYAGSLDGRLYALELTTGLPRWSFEAKAPVRARPALAGGLLIVANRKGALYGIDPQTGEPKWSRLLDQDVLADLVADRAGSAVYVVTRDKGFFWVEGQEGRLKALMGSVGR